MSAEDLYAHLATGHGQVCQCWEITRKDGETYGFTDHDSTLRFGGTDFVAASGLTATALASTTGLAVDNAEALGLLQSDALADADILAGRFDGATVKNWLVRWDDVSARALRFYGTLGEITRDGVQFRAELRGLSDALNQPQGRSYLRSCAAVLGDQACRFDLSDPTYTVRVPIDTVNEARSFQVTIPGYADRWFEQGKITVKTGKAKGLTAAIKHDRRDGPKHLLTLWSPIQADIVAGDEISLEAGCDKRSETCRVKFDNLLNFQGFPHIPGEDWLMSVPRTATSGDDESLNS